MGNFLEQWFDGALEVNEDFSWDQLIDEQIERLFRQGATSLLIAGMKRRLGGEATPVELRKDKKLARKVFHRSVALLRQWSSEKESYNYADVEEYANTHASDLQPLAAQLDWKDFFSNHRREMNDALRICATHAIKTGNQEYANPICNRFYNELTQFGSLKEEFLG